MGAQSLVEFPASFFGEVEAPPKGITHSSKGSSMGAFTAKEKRYISANPSDFGLYFEGNSRYLSPLSAARQRKEYRILMGILRESGGNPVSLHSIRGENPSYWADIEKHVAVLIDDFDLNYRDGEVSVTVSRNTPHVSAWGIRRFLNMAAITKVCAIAHLLKR